MTPRSTFVIITVLLLSINLNLVLADNTLPIFIEPYPNSPDTSFDYVFSMTNQSNCTEVIINHSESIITNAYGRGFTSIDLSDLTSNNIPRYMCEYRDGSLRQTHAFQSSIYDYLYIFNLKTPLLTTNLTGSYGYSYNDLTDRPTIPGDTNESTRMNEIYPEFTTNHSSWNEAYSWGNHSAAGYLTTYTETDPSFTAWDYDYSELNNTPTDLSELNNDMDYINSSQDQNTNCSGSSCNIANTGTLDGYEASDLLDDTTIGNCSVTNSCDTIAYQGENVSFEEIKGTGLNITSGDSIEFYKIGPWHYCWNKVTQKGITTVNTSKQTDWNTCTK